MQPKAVRFVAAVGALSVGILLCVVPTGCVGARDAIKGDRSAIDWAQVLVVYSIDGTHFYDMRTWKPIRDPEFLINGWGFSEGLCAARARGEPAGKVGFIDAAGRTVIPFRFDKACGFHDGRATVQIAGKKGIIDRSGRWVVEPGKYKNLGLYHEGLCAYLTDFEGEYWGFLDPSGEPVGWPAFQRARIVLPIYFQEGRCLIKTRLGDLGYIDRKTRVRIRLANPEWQAWSFSDGLARVNMSVDTRTQAEKDIPGLYDAPLLPQFGFIDREGRVVIEPRFTSAGDFTEGLAPVSLTDEALLHPGGEYMPDEGQTESERRWGFINKRGELVIPMIYERVGQFHDGLAPFRKAGKWGYLNRKGEVVVPSRFEEAEEFKNGLALVVVDGKIAFINTSGKIVLKTGLRYEPF